MRTCGTLNPYTANVFVPLYEYNYQCCTFICTGVFPKFDNKDFIQTKDLNTSSSSAGFMLHILKVFFFLPQSLKWPFVIRVFLCKMVSAHILMLKYFHILIIALFTKWWQGKGGPRSEKRVERVHGTLIEAQSRDHGTLIEVQSRDHGTLVEVRWRDHCEHNENQHCYCKVSEAERWCVQDGTHRQCFFRVQHV